MVHKHKFYPVERKVFQNPGEPQLVLVTWVCECGAVKSVEEGKI